VYLWASSLYKIILIYRISVVLSWQDYILEKPQTKNVLFKIPLLRYYDLCNAIQYWIERLAAIAKVAPVQGFIPSIPRSNIRPMLVANLPPVLWMAVVHLENEISLMLFSGACAGKIIHDKNLKKKSRDNVPLMSQKVEHLINVARSFIT